MNAMTIQVINPTYNERAPGPFSLGQAEEILNQVKCPHCNHKIGEPHLVLDKPMCAHQILAGEIIRWHRKKAAEVGFVRAEELL